MKSLLLLPKLLPLLLCHRDKVWDYGSICNKSEHQIRHNLAPLSKHRHPSRTRARRIYCRSDIAHMQTLPVAEHEGRGLGAPAASSDLGSIAANPNDAYTGREAWMMNVMSEPSLMSSNRMRDLRRPRAA